MDKIKEFLTKMRTQDNRGTASPFYYVIRTEVEDVAPIDNCDYTKWYWNERSYGTIEELKLDIQACEYEEKEIENAYEYGVKKRWDKRCMFLTETDAKRHLKLNYYHYSPNAHTYVEHAWRAPELEEFFNELFKHFDIPEGR